MQAFSACGVQAEPNHFPSTPPRMLAKSFLAEQVDVGATARRSALTELTKDLSDELLVDTTDPLLMMGLAHSDGCSIVEGGLQVWWGYVRV